MTVKELIQKLHAFDPELPVELFLRDWVGKDSWTCTPVSVELCNYFDESYYVEISGDL
jgi:hypothetical protein